MSILEILVKHSSMNFGTIILHQSMETRQSYVIQNYADSFIIYIKTKYFFEDISNDVEKWFDTSKYNKKYKIPLPIEKNKKVPGLFKDELGGKIITKSVALRPKAYSYLDDDCNKHKKFKATKKVCNKTKNHISKFQRLFAQ